MRGQNILARVFNKPQLITNQSLQPILDFLENPERQASIRLTKPVEPKELLLSDFANEDAYNRKRLSRIGIDPDTRIGYLEVKDTLVNREGQINAECMELTSYERLKKTFNAQVAEGIKHCVLMVDSGGGEAYGCFEAANHVQKLAKENGVKLTAYIDGMSASAAFAWTVIADEVVANPMAQVGSVGVVIPLYNNSRMLKNMGIDRTFVYAGGNKIPFDADGDFTEKFINDLQVSVDKSYSKFVSHVAKHMNLPESTVKDTQASVYDADAALQLGFVHKIMEVEEFSAYVSPQTTTNTVYFNNVLDAGASLEQKENLLMTDVTQNEPVVTANAEQPDVTQAAVVDNGTPVLEVGELQATLANLTDENQTLSAQLTEKLAEIGSLTEQLSTITTEFTQFKESTKQAARLEKLTAVFGTESSKPQAYAEMFKSTDDATFDTMLADFKSMLSQADASMQEIGNAAPAEPVALSQEELTLEAARKAKQSRSN